MSKSVRLDLHLFLFTDMIRWHGDNISVKTNIWAFAKITGVGSQRMAGKIDNLEMEQFFLALADRTRLRLLNLMGEDEVCVCYLVEVLKEPQPKISRHLAYLRRAGIVAARREGRWMHYRISTPADEGAARILADVLSWLATERGMRRDRTRLVKIGGLSCQT